MKNSHKGEVKCIIYQKIFSSYYVITGSVDRTIKVWYCFVFSLRNEIRDCDPKKKSVVQTLVGHNGTILALQFSKDTLVSSSTDKTFKIWKQEEDR